MRRESLHLVVSRQRGLAMITLITLMILISSFLIARGLGTTSAQVAARRELRTLQALQEAKAALIAYAADISSTQPGSLPCPDRHALTDANFGSSGPNSTCDSATDRVGRLPWKTLGVSDLRDASGEILWYAVSASFRRKSGTTVINSSTAGTITVTGSAPTTGAVALVIAPGTVLQNQSRDPSSASAVIDVANYLEGSNTNSTDDTTQARVFETRAAPNDRDATGTELVFNDRMLAVMPAELFAVVEPVVAAMIERDVKPVLTTYFTEWTNAFPYPAKFANSDPGTNTQNSPSVPSTRLQSQYLGDTATANEGGGNGRGLLPVTASASYAWTGATTPSLTGGLAGSVSATTCTLTVPAGYFQYCFNITANDATSNSALWTCRDSTNTLRRYGIIDPSFTVSRSIGADAGLSFPKLPSTSTVSVTSLGGAARTMSSKSINGTLTSAGVGTVRFSGTHTYNVAHGDNSCRTSSFNRSMRVVIPDVTVNSVMNSGWFISNEWYRVTYYVVSPGYLPGAAGSCTALPGTPSCLTINNMPAIYSSPSTDKRAILILAGRSLNGTSRPSSTLANYLEGENASPSDYKFEHRAGTPSSINDRVVVVSP